MSAGSAADPIYVMGRSEEERERLIKQAGLYGGFTKHLLVDAGLTSGMRVLDVGCGVGDVSLLCAELVGPQGAVVAVDRDPVALGRAQERAKAAAAENLTFHEGDFRSLPVKTPFDAVVGRLVLMYTADPVEAIRSLLPHLRTGGILAFHEFDFTAMTALPWSPMYQQVGDWWNQTAGRAGIELQMGYKLFQTYRAAGLPAPRLQADTLMGGGPEFGGYDYLANVIRSILPLMERFGVATAAEVEIDTLADRLRAEIVAGGGCLSLPMLVGAVAYKP